MAFKPGQRSNWLLCTGAPVVCVRLTSAEGLTTNRAVMMIPFTIDLDAPYCKGCGDDHPFMLGLMYLTYVRWIRWQSAYLSNASLQFHWTHL